MTSAPSNTAQNSTPAAVKPEAAAETKQIILKEIGVKWSKFSEQDLSAIKGKDDLVNQVAAKYGLDRGQAQRDVDAMLSGRQV
jgi:hypothetical protein